MTVLTFGALAVMLLGPLLQGLGGFDRPNAYIFAPIIAVAVLPFEAVRSRRGALALAGAFLGLGLACIGLWWLGGLAGLFDRIPFWLPLVVTLAGAAVPILAGPAR